MAINLKVTAGRAQDRYEKDIRGVWFIYSNEQIEHWMSIPTSAKIRLIEGARLLSELGQSEKQKAIREGFREGKL